MDNGNVGLSKLIPGLHLGLRGLGVAFQLLRVRILGLKSVGRVGFVVMHERVAVIDMQGYLQGVQLIYLYPHQLYLNKY